MDPKEQRIVIALACGRKIRIVDNGGYRGVIGSRHIFEENAVKELPDYLNDLNAIHEAEKSLTDEDYVLFRMWLYKITFDGNIGTFRRPKHERALISATASQRAEAFLRTLGLWKD